MKYRTKQVLLIFLSFYILYLIFKQICSNLSVREDLAAMEKRVSLLFCIF